MNEELKKIYKRYNQFGNYIDAVTINSQYTMVELYKEMQKQNVDIDAWLRENEIKRIKDRIGKFQELAFESEFVQPKSIFFRFFVLNVIANSIPVLVYKRMNYSAQSIVEVTIAIAMYYLGLQTYMFSPMEITETEKKNIIRNDDFYFSLDDLKVVRGKTTVIELAKYLSLFAKSVNDVKEKENIGLFLDDEKVFILCIDEFVDYIILELEIIFKSLASKEEYEEYTKEKGKRFEEMVCDITRIFFKESYHTLFYYPNDKQKMEIDVLLKDGNELTVLECKSGTFSLLGIEKDEIVKLQIHNKTKKAYRTLRTVSEYIERAGIYSFECEGRQIIGSSVNPICIHVSMYPMDFISSNIHALFPEYLYDDNPILSISIEHLFAMLLDSKKRGINIFDYWKKRKKDIIEHPDMYFDNNELDLYYELTNNYENSMLNELRQQGILDQMNLGGHIVSTFHNQFGDEVRPAQEILRMLDTYLLLGIFQKGKTWFGLNKRFLKSLEEFFQIK